MPCKHTCQTAPAPLPMPTSRKALHFLMMSILVHEKTRMMRPSRLVSRAATIVVAEVAWRSALCCSVVMKDDARTCISEPKALIFHRRRYNKWYGNFKLNMIQDQSKTAFFAQTVSLLTHPLRSWEKEPTICMVYMGLGVHFGMIIYWICMSRGSSFSATGDDRARKQSSISPKYFQQSTR